MVNISAIQLTTAPDVATNLTVIEQQLSTLTASTNQQHIVVLPECCLYFGGKDSQQLALARQTCNDDALRVALATLAKKYGVCLIAGSVPLYQAKEDKFTNSCCVFNAAGDEVAQYDKLHLFDVEVQDSEKHYLESKYTLAGNKVVTVDIAGITVGLTICYDLRFPELFRQLRNKGAQVITVPSAFTKVTGEAHWLALLRARAIENQVYIVAAGQYGTHSNGRETYGHSIIIDPWGEIIEQLPEGIGHITAQIDTAKITQVRKAIPVQTHNKFTTKLINHE
ncbi:carbon-nitrogen hydrolase family protein [Thalassotalea sp. 1_MG-2023]|uniref:carbon-nitrogen hydrolase family protein n=1 Tax=Thalassotalea sp. 1_MG-2023 TaxID=3062680 RepID=UPI0026E2F61E|nr:carbon-nitrogen hydrolase family protein [Thalassotalea sp. 1_MG-2023]MDO6426312.1 carbon-nitrogen hydrolase family protein [Thalassotalea sp. 1_MG-2023]